MSDGKDDESVAEKVESIQRAREALRDRRSELTEAVVAALEDEGLHVEEVEQSSSLGEFDVLTGGVVERDHLHDLDDVFDGFEVEAVAAEDDHIRVYFASA